jgi:hypothetical protein
MKFDIFMGGKLFDDLPEIAVVGKHEMKRLHRWRPRNSHTPMRVTMPTLS